MFWEQMYCCPIISPEMQHFESNLWNTVHLLPKCFRTNNHLLLVIIKQLFFLQISTDSDANCLFNSFLKCVNTGLPNLSPTDLRIQLITHMAKYLETYYVSIISMSN